jgi:energy-coupling factor transporter ATP-binding protein EcfA2
MSDAGPRPVGDPVAAPTEASAPLTIIDPPRADEASAGAPGRPDQATAVHRRSSASRADRSVATGSSAAEEPSASAGGAVGRAGLGPGLRLNQYELIRELGQGGMSQVYLARDVKLGRKVAIKFLRSRSATVAERFLAEARTTACCHHENIVVIHEVGEHQGVPYMVLELLDGQPLSSLVRGQTVPAARAVELMVPVVRALECAHGSRIVHRDLKPDNIVLTRGGTVKVLDFGIAKLLHAPEALSDPAAVAEEEPEGTFWPLHLTRSGTVIGTLPYMSPEQWGADEVDPRTDLWAVGVMLFEMVAGAHPLTHLSRSELGAFVVDLELPVPGVGRSVPDLPGDLERVIDRCLAKRKADRFGSARELLDALEPLLPGRAGRSLHRGEACPYPGLAAFQEADAARFFGRGSEVAGLVARVRDQPLTAVVGPSGVGKSSFVRAGVIPALRASGETWEVHVTRPGRHPLQALATLVQPLTHTTSDGLASPPEPHEAVVERLRREPGSLGAWLRDRAAQKRGRELVFIDQLEELYTLAVDPEERAAFAACLAGVADDVAAPVRVVVSLRSDFLDRVSGDPRLLEELSRGLVVLSPPGRAGLEEALVAPLAAAGYRFESPELLQEMLDELAREAGALPLLQYAASRLWESRDREHRRLTRAGYEAMGGVGGALASHADAVLDSLPAPAQRVARMLLPRLVTPEGTRAVVDTAELESLAADPEDARRVVATLLAARLITAQARVGEEGGAVELVHESLITRWPRLRRWLDENADDAAFLGQVRMAARQWEARQRPAGLLWTGESVDEARRWRQRYRGDLSTLEQQFLEAGLAQADRVARRRRALYAGGMAVLLIVAVAAVAALLVIRRAERTALDRSTEARREAVRARTAEQEVRRQLAVIRAEEEARRTAEQAATKAQQQARQGEAQLSTARTELKLSYGQLEQALARAQAAQARAEKASEQSRLATEQVRRLADAEKQAREKAEQLLAREKQRVQELLKQRQKVVNDLR